MGLIAIIILVAGLNWFVDQDETMQTPPPRNADEPDMYMVDATLTQYGEQGNVQHVLDAARFTHYPISDITTLSSPHMVLQDAEIPWHINASEGRILPRAAPDGSDSVELWDGVDLLRGQNDSRLYMQITTANLTVLPNLEYAETDQSVTIIETGSVTQAAGMQAFLSKGQFLLFGGNQRVQTILQPAARP